MMPHFSVLTKRGSLYFQKKFDYGEASTMNTSQDNDRYILFFFPGAIFGLSLGLLVFEIIEGGPVNVRVPKFLPMVLLSGVWYLILRWVNTWSSSNGEPEGDEDSEEGQDRTHTIGIGAVSINNYSKQTVLH
jgi:hypothetical protein